MKYLFSERKEKAMNKRFKSANKRLRLLTKMSKADHQTLEDVYEMARQAVELSIDLHEAHRMFKNIVGE